MKKLTAFIIVAIAIFAMTGCKNNKTQNIDDSGVDSMFNENNPIDSTIYGVCGENTAMHTLELITEQGDTMSFMIDMEEKATVMGGMLVGDHMAVTATKNENGENVANTVINLTTLLGRWTSIDKNFEIKEGGVVVSKIKAETDTWTSWRILNGNLLLNKDTFRINVLGADSLYLENNEGIFAFKRQK